jgi:hypothetical protein
MFERCGRFRITEILVISSFVFSFILLYMYFVFNQLKMHFCIRKGVLHYLEHHYLHLVESFNHKWFSVHVIVNILSRTLSVNYAENMAQSGVICEFCQ